MNLDTRLTQLALKMKHMVLMDLNFQHGQFPEFRKAYEARYLHMPCRREMALGMAAGLASLGKHVVIVGDDLEDCNLPDSTLNVKLIREDESGKWEDLEHGLQEFGPAVLLIPDAL